MNILKNDPFTKTVFTDVLPSDPLPRDIRKRPRRHILINTDPSDKTWIALGGNLLYRRWQRGFWDSYGQAAGFYSQNFIQFLDKHYGTFTWNRRILQAPSSDVCGQYTLFFALHRCRQRME